MIAANTLRQEGVPIMAFVAQARIALTDPEAVIRAVCEHLTEHGGRVEERDGALVVRFPDARMDVADDGGRTRVTVTAATLEGLYYIRLTVASHIIEGAGEDAPTIEWTGDGADLRRPPNFQILRIVRARDVTPRMRRITLAGPDVARYAPMNALHVKVLIQHPGLAAPHWPALGANGLVAWGDPGRRPWLRKYTVRSVDPAAGTIDIDFVRHADAGPGAAFAETAKPGDPVGMIGPGGGGLVAADWYLFAGDETALPAIGRMLEHLPEDAKGKALIEVADAGEIQPLDVKAAIDIEWLCRNGAPAGTTRLLADAVRAVALPDDGSAIYAWAGCERAAFREIRAHLRDTCGLKRHEQLVVAYWRAGTSDDGG